MSGELDSLRDIVGSGKNWILELEQQERSITGISSLKVRFNKVFGFYIEITKANLHLVPSHYIRKQTMVGGERFITPQLKEKEEQILTAQERIYKLELQIFEDTVQKVLVQTASIQKAAEAVATIDCLLGFAILAHDHLFTRPKLLYSGEIKIKNGRHPVVEQLLEENDFVPNDVTLDTLHNQLLVLTGPNMAGKSVYIRQVALIVLLAQIGSFVPASSARISVVDRIFVRSGASDAITSGLSTFMVEMIETAYILHHATSKSLIVMDEIGRGTSTFDGISIAWAVAEYLVRSDKIPAKTLFATHYHELCALADKYPNKIKNYHMTVTNHEDTPVFLHTLQPGAASHSFGVAVAKLAGIPEEVLSLAKEVLQTLENRQVTVPKEQLPQNRRKRTNALELQLQQIDISRLTPLEALNELAKLQEMVS